MKIRFITLLLFFNVLWCAAQEVAADSLAIKGQDWETDSLEMMLKKANEDTAKTILLNNLSWRYAFRQPERGLVYAQQSRLLSQNLKYKRGIGEAHQNAAWCHWSLGNYPIALQEAFKSLRLFEDINEPERQAWVYLTLANVYRDIGDYPKALQTAHQSIRMYDAIQVSARVPLAVAGSIYEMQNKLDSGFFYVHKALQLDLQQNQGKWLWLHTLFGNLYRKRKEYDNALFYYKTALTTNNVKDKLDVYNGLATLYQERGQLDSCIYYAHKGFHELRGTSYQKGILDATNLLAKSYQAKNEKDSTIKYLELSVALNNALYNLEKQRDVQNLAFNEQLRQEEVERERKLFWDRLKLYGLLAFSAVALGVALLLWRNNEQRKKAYALLQQQKAKTDQALEELKTTQAQLIQKEKMASLGELTAGIAHEIQNPLNFVNNFSEMNTELIEELKQEAQSGNTTDVLQIAEEIKANGEKIAYHGKRADGIVKGMLQHSRTSTGERQLTDINILTDEYLRLSYHGFRAKNKEFNAVLETHYDNSIGKVNVVPQEIGRVLLNLFNNSFYALQQKKARLNGGYEPEISVQTEKLGDQLQIRVKDNGTGIAPQVQDKIFQPFFTTKSAGEGTGLGLSLSYDIITKGHGGELKVESREGAYTQFTILLPTHAQ